jgi:4-azaleucine resistance transporter AzlC
MGAQSFLDAYVRHYLTERLAEARQIADVPGLAPARPPARRRPTFRHALARALAAVRAEVRPNHRSLPNAAAVASVVAVGLGLVPACVPLVVDRQRRGTNQASEVVAGGPPSHELHEPTPVPFTRSGALLGARRSLPLALSIVPYGSIFGVLARAAGLSLPEASLMSGLVAAGASQFAVLGLWRAPLPIGAIVLTTLVVNLRYLPMGASLQPYFARLTRPQVYGSAFFLVDGSWVLALREFAAGRPDRAFLLGSGLAQNVAWLLGTALGDVGGAILGSPTRWGLDFAFPAMFLTLLVGMWKERMTVIRCVAWAMAAVVAVVSAHWLPGNWSVLLGGLSGALIGAVCDEP